MLVITRKINESILISLGDETIEVTLKDIKGKTARIGIHADSQFRIVRKELKRKDLGESKQILEKNC